MSDEGLINERQYPRRAFGPMVKIAGAQEGAREISDVNLVDLNRDVPATTQRQVIEQKRGYVEAATAIEAADTTIAGQSPAVIAPRGNISIPRSSLAEQIRQRHGRGG